jgi:hypothetical protein|tara:strand:+ start:600 stop:836 length:237 start_codon:yes stop_codon:yes gene_type:complete
MMKEIYISITTVAGVGLLSWMAWTLIEVDKRTEVMAVKISANHEMLKPLWEEFVKRSARNGNGSISNEKASFNESGSY